MDGDVMKNLYREEKTQENVFYGDEDYEYIIDTGFDINKFIRNSKRKNTVFGKNCVLYVSHDMYKSKVNK